MDLQNGDIKMAKTRKRRTVVKQQHQALRRSDDTSSKKINWMQIAAIVIGVLIVASLLFSPLLSTASHGGY